MRSKNLSLFTLAALGVAAIGCSSDPASTGTDAATDLGTVTDTPTTTDTGSASDAGTSTDTGSTTADSGTPTDTGSTTTDAGSSSIRVRVAHLSPGAPPVDFCVRAAGGTAFIGPVMKGLGVTAGLAYAQVTELLTLPAGQYTARLVAPNAADCSSALAGLPDVTLPNLAAGTVATVAATGVLGDTGATAFALTPFVEDLSAPASGNFKLRFVHASPGTPAVDLGLLAASTNTFTTLFDNVAFPATAAGAAAYQTAPAIAAPGVTVAARAHGTTPAADAYPLRLDGVAVPAGAQVTAYAIGRLGNDQFPLSALICNDITATNHLSDCSVAPARIHVRVAHLSPNAPAVDFCVRAGTTGAFVGPVLGASVAGGLTFANVTSYLALDPAAYTVRLVAPGATGCTTSLAGLPDYTLPSLPSGAWATVAAVGNVGDTGATAFTVRPFVDSHGVPAAGKANVRFVHASPGTPAVDVGVVAGTTFVPVWTNTVFPAVGASATADANGFLSIDPLAGATIAVRATGTTTNALTLTNVAMPAGSVNSVFAIGTLTGTGASRLSALVCADRTAASMGLAPCVRVP